MRARFSMILIPLLAACGDGDGSVTVTAYGESFIEDGIPASEIDDGWAVDFSLFSVQIEDVTVAGAALTQTSTVDLSQASSGAGHVLGSVSASEGEYSDASFTIARVEIDGTAVKGTDTKSFSWVFDAPTHYTECDTTTTVTEGGEASFQITVHADHLLYDSLVSEDPKVLFQALADADTDVDGAITEAELKATGIGSYDPGSEGGVDNLWDWLIAQSRTLGHVDGEGHCHATAE